MDELLELDIETRTLGYEVRLGWFVRRYKAMRSAWTIASVVRGAEIWRIDQLPDGSISEVQVV